MASLAAEGTRCMNLVRYFSSWTEGGRLHIQTELCKCSLRHLLVERQREAPKDPRFAEYDVLQVLQQVATGLASLHGLGFVHLDIKPDNVLVGRDGHYKIADMGLAVAITRDAKTYNDLSEGDCRYLAKEVLGLSLGLEEIEDLTELPKADVFSLGIVCYELATNPEVLPCGGEDWQQLREGHLDVARLPQLPESLLRLLCRMVHRVPCERPSSGEVAAWRPTIVAATLPPLIPAVATLSAGQFAHKARVSHAGG